MKDYELKYTLRRPSLIPVNHLHAVNQGRDAGASITEESGSISVMALQFCLRK
jgi:hypothetical protein